MFNLKQVSWMKSMLLATALASATMSTAAVSAQSDDIYNPSFQEGSPLYSAQNPPADGSVIYDSYWTHEGWNIYCSQTEFCYIELKYIEPLLYGGTRRYEPVVWEDGTMPDLEFGFGIKSGSTRIEMGIQGFKDGERDYTGSQAERDAGNFPEAVAMYYVDNQKVTEQVIGRKMPLTFSIWTDWEPEKKPIADALIGALYNRDPENMTVIVYLDGEPKMGSSFDVKGFKSAWDAMHKERLARNQLLKAGTHEFMSWPNGS